MKAGDKVRFRDPALRAWSGTVTEVGREVVYVEWTAGDETRVRKEWTGNIEPVP